MTSGLIQCGIDPQSPQWTTDQGKTPLDYLVSLQRPDGHFDWTEEFAGGPFETFDAVRPLGGIAFSTAPPARLDGVSSAVRAAPAVAEGTDVPITLVIDHGPGADDVRMCRVDVESGTDLETALGDAATSSAPAGCVDGFETAASGAGVRITSLNGVAETPEYGWRIGLDGGAPQKETNEPIGFGDLVFLKFAATVADPAPAPRVEVSPLEQAQRQRARGPRVVVLPRARWKDEAISVRLRCPRGNGGQGCRGTLTIQFRTGQAGAPSLAGSAPFEAPSGGRQTVAVPASAALQQALAQQRGGRWLRITAATRDENGAVRLTHARRFLAG